MDAVREFVTDDEEKKGGGGEREREVAQGTVEGCFKTLNINTRGG